MTMALDDLGLGSDVLVWQAVLLTLLSLVVGVLGGFVGLALGTMRLPALLLMGIAAPTAAGTNIMVGALASLTGAFRHLREGRVNMRIVLVMGVPAFVGAFIGGFSSGHVSESLLILLAGLLVFWQGIELIARVRPLLGATTTSGTGATGSLEGSHGTYTPNRVLLEGGVGLGVGLLGGAVGLILGSIRLPALIRILRVDPRIAAGTNLFIGFIMGSVGWVGHAVQGEVSYPLLLLIGGQRHGWQLLRRQAHRPGKPGYPVGRHGLRPACRWSSVAMASMEGVAR